MADEERELYVVPGLSGPQYDRLAVRPVRRGMPTPEELDAEAREEYAEWCECIDVAGAVLSFEDWRDMRAEAAYERSIADFYGSDSPATLTEHVREDWRTHKETHG